MRILLVYPTYPDTFWSFKHILPFISRKAAFPPLGLLTVAAMLPAQWDKRLVDANVAPLRGEDLAWADMVFISAMVVQEAGAKDVIARAKAMGKRIVDGGPAFAALPERFPGVDHFVLNEAEITLPPFLEDLSRGTPKSLYTSTERPDISRTHIPQWGLINFRDYVTMSVQYKRLLSTRYAPNDYYDRINTFLRNYNPTARGKLVWSDFRAFFKRLWRIGILSRARFRYWKLIIKTALTKRKALPVAVELAILGRHFQLVAKRALQAKDAWADAPADNSSHTV